MSEEYQDLLQREIDGINSADDSARLERIVATDASVRETFDELIAVRVAFESLSEKTPPLSLRASILNSLPDPERSVSRSTSRASVWDTIRDLIYNPRPASLAYAFSIGILVSFIGWTVVSLPGGPSIEPALIGTMAPGGEHTIYEQDISPDVDLGKVYVMLHRGQVRVQLRWSGDRSATVRVSFNPAELFATGVESAMGRSTLSSVTRTDASLEYVTSGSSTDVTTLVSVTGSLGESATVLDVWISSDGMLDTQHRISIIRNE